MCNTLLGGAIGDALGMPFEKRLINDPFLIAWDGKTFLASEHHKLEPGQFTDDSQMQQMVAESLLENNGFDPKDLSERYVDWMVSGRARGWGKTTLLAVQNLVAGKHWTESGIAGSYGNGTAMRAAPFGIYFRDQGSQWQELKRVCEIDARITHASDEAVAGSIAIALAAAYAVNNDTHVLLSKICGNLPNSKVKDNIFGLTALIDNKHISPTQALAFIGTKADVRETVPAALYCFCRFDNYHDAVLAAINAGGDTDTTASIVGALFGAKNGMSGVPKNWIDNVEDTGKLVVLDSQLFNRSKSSLFPR